MGSRKLTRPVYIGLKLTEAEKADIDRMMAADGYRSLSLFVRERLFTPYGHRRAHTEEASSAGSASPVDASLLAHVRKIGVNVNTACRNINASAARNSEGRLDKSMEYWLRKVSSYLYRISELLEGTSGAGTELNDNRAADTDTQQPQ